MYTKPSIPILLFGSARFVAQVTHLGVCIYSLIDIWSNTHVLCRTVEVGDTCIIYVDVSPCNSSSVPAIRSILSTNRRSPISLQLIEIIPLIVVWCFLRDS